MKRKREIKDMHSVTTNITSSQTGALSTHLSTKLGDSNRSIKTKESPMEEQLDSDHVPSSPCETSFSRYPVTPTKSMDSYSLSSIEERRGKFRIQYDNCDKVLPNPHNTDKNGFYSSRLFSRKDESERELEDAMLMPPPSLIKGSASKSVESGFRTPSSSIGELDNSHASDIFVEKSPYHTPLRNSEYRREQSNEVSSFLFYTPRKTPKSLEGHCVSMRTPSPKSRFNVISSPTSGQKQKYMTASDRFIPSRMTSNLCFSVWDQDNEVVKVDSAHNQPISNIPASNEDDASMQDMSSMNQTTQSPLLNMLLRSELLGENIDPAHPSASSNNRLSSNLAHTSSRHPLREGPTKFFRFNQDSRQNCFNSVYGQSTENPTAIVDSFSFSPVKMSSSQRLMSLPHKQTRIVPKQPFKVLDAPSLADDFYLNLVDWSSQNILAVGLGHCVYLWSATTSKVTKICDLGSNNQNTVTSVSWTQKGTHLAVGINTGEVQLWDAVKIVKVRTFTGHSARVGALAWSGASLASASRDRLIYLRDVRSQSSYSAILQCHKQEVCGLKWSFDEGSHLASGGNDNKLLVWDVKNLRQPVHKFSEHVAAVKAIAWSPHQHGLLASGGGTADRTIRFWNALSGSKLNSIDTGSQVCNLAWSKNCNEIVSTHGYSQNQIAIWKYPTMETVATLTGHSYRVLYLAMSPDNSTIVTGAGDETLRFWKVFPGKRTSAKNKDSGLLFPSSPYSMLR